MVDSKSISFMVYGAPGVGKSSILNMLELGPKDCKS
jgi:ribosome biogenesis GTPase A